MNSQQLSQYISWMAAAMAMLFAKTIPSVMLQIVPFYWEKDAWAKLTRYARSKGIWLEEEFRSLPDEPGYLPLIDLKRFLAGYYLIAINEASSDVVNDTYVVTRRISEKLAAEPFATVEILPIRATRRDKVLAIDNWVEICHEGGLEKFDYIFGSAMDPSESSLPRAIVSMLNALAGW